MILVLKTQVRQSLKIEGPLRGKGPDFVFLFSSTKCGLRPLGQLMHFFWLVCEAS